MSAKNVIAAFVFFISVNSTIPVQGQDTLPQDLTPDQYVTLDRTLPLKTAIDILSQYSSRFEGKLIIDTVGKNASAGVMVNNMYWKQALEYVLRANSLEARDAGRFYEIVPRQAAVQEQVADWTPTTREVEINAVFFEADYGTVNEAGVDWSLIKDGKVTVNANFASQVTANLFNVRYTGRHYSWDVFGLLRVFEALNKGEVIANPQIKVVDGHEGKIQVGTNFFLTTRDFAGNTRFQEYEAGVILRVIPTVIIADDTTFIHLDLDAERSDVIPDPVAVTKSITESQTQVLLLDGEETVIAGLFSNETAKVTRGIPILKDLPAWFFGLRYLFGYTQEQVNKKELIIVLQASVVPTIAERIAMRKLGIRSQLELRRLEFKRKMMQLQTAKDADAPANSPTPRSSSRNGSTQRRR